MAISLVQTKQTTATSVSLSNTTAGNSLIIGIFIFAPGGTPTVSFSDGATTSIAIFAPVQFAASEWYALHYIPNVTARTTPTLTATLTNNSSQAIIIREYSGLTTAPLDVNVVATGASTSASSGASTTTAQASELVIGFGAIQGNVAPTVGTGYGNLLSLLDASAIGRVLLEDQIVSATGTQTATYTLAGSTNWAAGAATFKASAGGATPTNLFFF